MGSLYENTRYYHLLQDNYRVFLLICFIISMCRISKYIERHKTVFIRRLRP